MRVLIILSIMFLGWSIAYEVYIGNAKSDMFPNACFWKMENKSIQFDQTYRPFGRCVKIYCRDDYVLHLIYCSRYQVPDNCEVFNPNDDQLKQYPICCPKLRCTAKDGKVSIQETAAD
ncbi:hypothetical protein ACFFRR_010068 [Megaselia abdita]